MVKFPTLLCFTLLATAASTDTEAPTEAATQAATEAPAPAPQGGRTALAAGTGCFTLTVDNCCAHTDGRDGYDGPDGNRDCVPAAAEQKYVTGNKCEPTCVALGQICSAGVNGGKAYPDEAEKRGACPTPAPAVPETTTVTPWDSSESSSGESDSLNSVYSSSFVDDSESSQSSADSSLESSGSAASGSSASYMPLWMWGLLIAALCLCCAAIAASAAPKKKKAAKKKPAPKGPAKTTLTTAAQAGATTLEVASQAGFKAGQVVEIDAGSPLAEIADVAGLGSIILTAPLMYRHAVGATVTELPDGRPLPELITTTSAVIPSYQMVAPVTTSYAAPQMYAPTTTAYAAPATTAYAAPATYAQPMAYSNAGYSTGAIV